MKNRITYRACSNLKSLLKSEKHAHLGITGVRFIFFEKSLDAQGHISNVKCVSGQTFQQTSLRLTVMSIIGGGAEKYSYLLCDSN